MYRILCVVLVLCPFAAAEIALRTTGWAAEHDLADSYIEFVSTRPLFVQNEAGDRFEIATNRLQYFQPQSFTAEKSERGFRVFVLGGSTVQGRPYSVPTSFTTFLRLALDAADPSRSWEVVNCGGISYASYRLAPILDEILSYEPDLVILCAGHNEFLEELTYARVLALPKGLRWAVHKLTRLRTFTAARMAWEERAISSSAPRADRMLLPVEVDAILDHGNAIETYERDDRRRHLVIQQFEDSLHRMALRTREAGVPMLLLLPPSNLKDSPPFKAEFGVARAEAETLERQWHALHADIDDPLDRIRRLAAEDGRHAGVLFALGRSFLRERQLVEAREAFVQAKDEDICPLRMLEPMREVAVRVAGRVDVPVVDAHALLEAQTPDGILGDEWLVDHVHPTIGGHREMALALVREMERKDIVRRPTDWKDTWMSLIDEHIRSLNPAYFEQGQLRLDRLRRWARGPAATE